MRTELKMFPNRTETGVWGVSPNLIIRKELFLIISHVSSGASLLNTTFYPVEWPYVINRVIVSHPTNLLSLTTKKLNVAVVLHRLNSQTLSNIEGVGMIGHQG